ncbi:MAG: hypothetical protein ACREQA_18840 [Candidatus Binatia bacterium]
MMLRKQIVALLLALTLVPAFALAQEEKKATVVKYDEGSVVPSSVPSLISYAVRLYPLLLFFPEFYRIQQLFQGAREINLPKSLSG